MIRHSKSFFISVLIHIIFLITIVYLWTSYQSLKKDVVEKISTIIANLYKEDTNSEFVRHLLRAFEIAAVASIINGSAKFTGSRKPLGFLICQKNKEIKLKSLTEKIYGYANSLFLTKQTLSKEMPYFQTLLLSICASTLLIVNYTVV